MSINIPNIKNDRALIRELHDIMDLFRTIFSDDKVICKNIDESYEKILISDIRLIPQQYDAEIMSYISAIKLIISNVNFTNILNGMKEILPNHKSLSVDVNSYKVGEMIVNKLDMSKTDRLLVFNVLTKLRPIFACVDKVFQLPFAVLTKISNMCDTQYSDLL